MVRVVEIDGDVAELVATTVRGDVTVITRLMKHGDSLILSGLHIDGPGAGSLGSGVLRQLARDFGRHQGAKRVIIEGGVRTTGANPGHLPDRIILRIE